MTRRVLRRVDFEVVARNRRRNYEDLARSLADVRGIEFLAPGLHAAVVPLVLPLRIERRALVAERLFAQGVETYRFGARPSPELPQSEFPEAGELRENVLGLPVHQNLEEAHREAIVAALKRSVA